MTERFRGQKNISKACSVLLTIHFFAPRGEHIPAEGFAESTEKKSKCKSQNPEARAATRHFPVLHFDFCILTFFSSVLSSAIGSQAGDYFGCAANGSGAGVRPSAALIWGWFFHFPSLNDRRWRPGLAYDYPRDFDALLSAGSADGTVLCRRTSTLRRRRRRRQARNA
ncbi:MAG TPA: hypothetical protein VG125_32200, partial [Pirellulales bacterium]|nr:hypothetical protein [Pirellulales bacterium]